MSPAEFLAFSVELAFGLVLIAILLCFVRLVRGPSLADRVVALDMMTILIISVCALFTLVVDDPAFLDIVLVMALIGFLATVALARYAERRFLDRTRETGELRDD
ncbi:MAG: cation:proton antiporter [Rhodobacteraceae bacterium]|nr:cation:proton antiporter [Paracoccaceae bacterium]